MTKRIATLLMTLGAGLALAGAACTINSTEIPDLTGPSEMALSFLLTATPDTISQDGVSQSSVAVIARNASGQALAGQPFRIDMLVDGVPTNYSTLSGRTVVTGSDGRANVVYTSPPALPFGAIIGFCARSPFSAFLPGGCVTIAATPILNGFTSGSVTQSVDVHLLPVEIIPVPGAPTPSFVFFPAVVKVNQEIFFNASASYAAAGRKIVDYAWTWGDGTFGNGIIEDHDYAIPGSYVVVLTVTDDAGQKASVAGVTTVTPKSGRQRAFRTHRTVAAGADGQFAD